jgi:hypothetical protein
LRELKMLSQCPPNWFVTLSDRSVTDEMGQGNVRVERVIAWGLDLFGRPVGLIAGPETVGGLQLAEHCSPFVYYFYDPRG